MFVWLGTKALQFSCWCFTMAGWESEITVRSPGLDPDEMYKRMGHNLDDEYDDDPDYLLRKEDREAGGDATLRRPSEFDQTMAEYVRGYKDGSEDWSG